MAAKARSNNAIDKAAPAKKSSRKAQIISFAGGFLFVSAIVAVVVARNKELRAQVEQQARNVVNTTQDIVEQARQVIEKINDVSRLVQNNKQSDSASNSTSTSASTSAPALASKPKALLDKQYDLQWQKLKADIGASNRS
jgi:hypothetical protein